MSLKRKLIVFPNYVVYKTSKDDLEYYQKPNELKFYSELASEYDYVSIIAFWKNKGEDTGFVPQQISNVEFLALGEWGYEMTPLRKVIAYLKAMLKIVAVVCRNDLFYFYFPGSNSLLAGVFARPLRKRYAVYVRNGLSHAGPFYESLYRAVLKRAEFVICTGRGIESDVRNTTERTCQVSPMMSFARSKCTKLSDLVPGETIQLLFIGTLNEGKGIFELLNIAKDLKGRRFDFCLKIIGNGGEDVFGEINRRCNAYGIGNNVEVINFINDPELLREAYAASDIFLYPSNHNEGFPRVIYEAMLTGSLCVAYKLGTYRGFLRSSI